MAHLLLKVPSRAIRAGSKTSCSSAVGLERPQITGFGTLRPHVGATLDVDPELPKVLHEGI